MILQANSKPCMRNVWVSDKNRSPQRGANNGLARDRTGDPTIFSRVLSR